MQLHLSPQTPSAGESDVERQLIALLNKHYFDSGLSRAFAAAMARKCVHYGDGNPVVREGPYSSEQSRIAVERAAADPRIKTLRRLLREQRESSAA